MNKSFLFLSGRENQTMGRNTEEEIISRTESKVMMEGELKMPIHKPPIPKGRPSSMIIKKTNTVIPAAIIAEAISELHGEGIDLRWSGPITPAERLYVEQYVLAKYPQYAGLVEGEKNDLSSLCINEESPEPTVDDKRKSPSTPSFGIGSSQSVLDRTQLEQSRLLDILTKKSSFPGSFISIPEIQARNKVLKHCGLSDDEYLVLFTPNYQDTMKLVGESYPFFRGNYYMTSIGEGEEDCIKEYATFKDSKVISVPETWLDLRIKGSQISQHLRRKCKHTPKGLFSYPAISNGTNSQVHWISEARRNSWHVLFDATSLVVGKEVLNLAYYQPDFVLCSPDNTHANPSMITCLLVRKKSFDTTTASYQANE